MTWLRPSRLFSVFLAAVWLNVAGLGVNTSSARSLMPAYRNVERISVVCQAKRGNASPQALDVDILCNAVQGALNEELGAAWKKLIAIQSAGTPLTEDPGTFLIRVYSYLTQTNEPEALNVLELSFVIHRFGQGATPPPPPLTLKWPRHAHEEKIDIPQLQIKDFVRRHFAEPIKTANPHMQ